MILRYFHWLGFLFLIIFLNFPPLINNAQIQNVGPFRMKVPKSCSDNHCSNTCHKKFGYNKLTGNMESLPKCSCPEGYSWKNEKSQYECKIPNEIIPMEVRTYNNLPSEFTFVSGVEKYDMKRKTEKAGKQTSLFDGFFGMASDGDEGGIDLIGLF